jgi:hypothetical protein
MYMVCIPAFYGATRLILPKDKDITVFAAEAQVD